MLQIRSPHRVMLTSEVVKEILKPILATGSQGPDEPVPFTGVTTDSRRVQPGHLFVALRGERDDGHRYIEEAVRAGAEGVIAQQWPEGAVLSPRARFLVRDTQEALQALAMGWRARHSLRVIGVTGSVGKTTTKDAIAKVLGLKYNVLKSPGNMNTEIGLPLALLAIEPSHQRAVVEMGMYSIGDIALLCRIAKPEVAVVTNIGPSHLERTLTLEATAKAKGELVESLPENGVAVLNGDDPLVMSLAERTGARVITYGLSAGCRVRGEDVVSSGLGGIEFTLRWGDRNRRIKAPLLGRHSGYTALAVAAVAFNDGLTWDEVEQGLGELGGVDRIQVRDGINGAVLLDDTYNASPASTVAALDLLSEMKGRRIAVLGDMLELGPFEEEGHLLVGKRAASATDRLIVVGPRAAIIGREAARVGLKSVDYAYSTREALGKLPPLLSPGDFVLVKGSRSLGMESIVKALVAD